MDDKNQINTYRDLIVWQKSMNLVIEIYKLTECFPKAEIYGLVSQMRRCVVSIPSNIAEGRGRGSKKDYRHFLIIAYSSGAELETQIEITKRLQLNKNTNLIKVDGLLNEVMRMLNKMLSTLRT